MKLLSVIVPVYNAGKWLHEALDSLIAQTYTNMEIICIDDGSEDNSVQIIQDYMIRYPQIRLMRQGNAGVSSARNHGIDEAHGDYIAFLDADDYVESDMYEQMIVQMEAERSDIIFCGFTRFWSDGHSQRTVEHSFEKLIENPHDIKYFMYSTESYRVGDVLHTKDILGVVWRSIFKAELLQANEVRFHNELRFAEDQIFILEYLAYCEKISYTELSYVWYRGWTKSRRYGQVYNNQMALIEYQRKIINHNIYYSEKEKRELLGYLNCSTYFAVINDEFSLSQECIEHLMEYSKNESFNQLLTAYSFIQKFKMRPEAKRIILFILLKLRLWRIIKILFPQKYYLH